MHPVKFLGISPLNLDDRKSIRAARKAKMICIMYARVVFSEKINTVQLRTERLQQRTQYARRVGPLGECPRVLGQARASDAELAVGALAAGEDDAPLGGHERVAARAGRGSTRRRARDPRRVQGRRTPRPPRSG